MKASMTVVANGDAIKSKEEQKEKREASWKLNRRQIAGLAREIRIELEAARDRLEGMTFEALSGDMPPVIDNIEPHPYACELVGKFNPSIRGRYNLLEGIAGIDPDELLQFKTEACESAFQIGVLAGAIFSGASDREIDRLERGLIHATMARPWRVKD